MARIGISYDEVKQAIDEMLSEGQNPTIAGLRERLGTGSFTTISEHLKRWRNDRHEKPVMATGAPTPDTLSGMMQTLWQQAREEANKELESYKEKIDEEIKKALEEKQKALQTALDTEGKNRWLEEKNNTLLLQATDQQRTIGQQEILLEQQKEQLDLAKQQLAAVKETAKTQREDAIVEKEALQEKLNDGQKNILELSKDFQQQLKEERSRAEHSEQHWLSQLDNERQKAKQLSELLNVEKETQQKLSSIVELLKIKLEQLETKNQQASQQILEQVTGKIQQFSQQAERSRQQDQINSNENIQQLSEQIMAQLERIEAGKTMLWGINWQDMS